VSLEQVLSYREQLTHHFNLKQYSSAAELLGYIGEQRGICNHLVYCLLKF